MRNCARLLDIHYMTVQRKLIYLAKKSRLSNHEFLQSLKLTPVTHLQFDDLITSVHTKLRPLSISIAIDAKSRSILAATVGSIPAFGHLAELSRRKYGKRRNEHEQKLHDLFSKIAASVVPNARIESYEHGLYQPMVKNFFSKPSIANTKGKKVASPVRES